MAGKAVSALWSHELKVTCPSAPAALVKHQCSCSVQLATRSYMSKPLSALVYIRTC